MKKYLGLLFALVLTGGCSIKSQSSDSASGGTCEAYSYSGQSYGSGSTNVVPISVGCGYTNEPCVAVKICVPGTTTCQVIDHILLDTGSYGLRIFSCANTLSLTNQMTGTNQVGECVAFADQSYEWGPIMLADIYLSDQKASSVPIQIIDPTYSGGAPSGCGVYEDYSPQISGFNGILGVGLLTNDCPGCGAGVYYACDGSSSCIDTVLGSSKQVTNPVSKLSSSYNNGTILAMGGSGMSSNGASGITGTLTLGISSVSGTKYPATVSATDGPTFTAYYTGTSTCSTSGIYTYQDSFVDSGSNFWDFPDSPSISLCSDDNNFYCPASTLTLYSWPSSCSSTAVQFSIANADSIANNGNTSFNNIGGPFSGSFDFGFPFFYGNTVYNCINGSTCGGTSGPFWAW